MEEELFLSSTICSFIVEKINEDRNKKRVAFLFLCKIGN